MEITVESNGGAQEHQPNRLFFFNHTGWALLISWLEKQSFWQLLIIKISLKTTFSGLVVSQGTAPCGRTWFHSGPPTTLSKKQNPLKLCLSMNFLLPSQLRHIIGIGIGKILWKCVSQSTSYSLLRHITPDPMSNPVIYYLKWVVSETVGGFNAGETESRGNRTADDPNKTMIVGLLVQNIWGSMNKHGRSDERGLHWWDHLPLRDPRSVAVWVWQAVVSGRKE